MSAVRRITLTLIRPTMPLVSDPFDLDRFVAAQDPVYDRVLAELRQGEKRSHWMWFIFPQFTGLGSSFRSEKYAIKSIEEARAYLAHPILGVRLRECVELVNGIDDRPIDAVFGYPDTMKFQSSVTLFGAATGDNAVFNEALERHFAGVADAKTLALLAEERR